MSLKFGSDFFVFFDISLVLTSSCSASEKNSDTFLRRDDTFVYIIQL